MRTVSDFDVQWGEPPERTWRGRQFWKPFAEKLAERPGEWGLVSEHLTFAEMSSARSCLHRQGCKIKIRKQPENQGWNLWAMVPGAE